MRLAEGDRTYDKSKVYILEEADGDPMYLMLYFEDDLWRLIGAFGSGDTFVGAEGVNYHPRLYEKMKLWINPAPIPRWHGPPTPTAEEIYESLRRS